jgi:hypothetical protein
MSKVVLMAVFTSLLGLASVASATPITWEFTGTLEEYAPVTPGNDWVDLQDYFAPGAPFSVQVHLDTTTRNYCSPLPDGTYYGCYTLPGPITATVDGHTLAFTGPWEPGWEPTLYLGNDLLRSNDSQPVVSDRWELYAVGWTNFFGGWAPMWLGLTAMDGSHSALDDVRVLPDAATILDFPDRSIALRFGLGTTVGLVGSITEAHTVVPEPATLWLLGLGLSAGFWITMRRLLGWAWIA